MNSVGSSTRRRRKFILHFILVLALSTSSAVQQSLGREGQPARRLGPVEDQLPDTTGLFFGKRGGSENSLRSGGGGVAAFRGHQGNVWATGDGLEAGEYVAAADEEDNNVNQELSAVDDKAQLLLPMTATRRAAVDPSLPDTTGLFFGKRRSSGSHDGSRPGNETPTAADVNGARVSTSRDGVNVGLPSKFAKYLAEIMRGTVQSRRNNGAEVVGNGGSCRNGWSDWLSHSLDAQTVDLLSLKTFFNK